MAVKKGFVAGAVAGVGVAAAAMAGAGMRWPGAAADAQAIQPMQPPGVPAPSGAPMSFATIIQRVAPAVVSIEVTTHVSARSMQIPGLPFPFNVPGMGGNGDDDDNGTDSGAQGNGAQGNGSQSNGAQGQTPRNRAPRGPTAMAAGSGFFISPDGYIVTNNHVIENADTIKVILSDQRELSARLIGRDELSDLAVIKVEGGPYPFVNFETQSKPRVGDWAIAIGNPYTLGGTVTAGIVSAEQRELPGEQGQVPYLQIDAPINRGNSGGPTFDVYGRVIGVNTAIFSESGGSVGIGFAIPADVAARITRQLMTGRPIVRGYLGITIVDVTADIASAEGLPPRSGALVDQVTPGGPGALAGLQTGDIVTAVNGQPVHTGSELSQATSAVPPGTPIRLDILRAGRRLSVTARAGTRPTEAQLNRQLNGEDEGATGAAGPGGEVPRTSVLGMGLAPLDDAARQRYGIQPTTHGVVIASISQDSDAYSEGLRRGFVITRAGYHTVTSPADVVAAVAEARRASRPSVLLFVSSGRTGQVAPVVVKLEADKPPAAR
jgi:serine protease Do